MQARAVLLEDVFFFFFFLNVESRIPHPHWILCFPWTLGAQSFSQEATGIWQAVRRILCSVHSTQPGGQAQDVFLSTHFIAFELW